MLKANMILKTRAKNNIITSNVIDKSGELSPREVFTREKVIPPTRIIDCL